MSGLDSGEVLRVFRLVNKDHDPVDIGMYLTRISDHSNQKIADGMYFALSREDALEFVQRVQKHEYTHLLTCQLIGIGRDDLIDLIADPNLIAKAKRNPPYSELTTREVYVKYCEAHGKKGILWKATKGWRELCLLPAFVDGIVVIEAAEPLWQLPTS